MNLLPGVDVRALLAARAPLAGTLATVARRAMAGALRAALVRGARRFAKAMAQLPDRALDEAAQRARRLARPALGHAGLQQGRGHAGRRGHPRTSPRRRWRRRAVPGLFFIGEGVDVTGHLGGFNFQWAWASGRAAGEAA